MKQWDRELSIKRDAILEEEERSALSWIRFCHSKNIPNEEIRDYIIETYHFEDDKINSLFKKSLED